MPEFSGATQTKIDALIAMYHAGEQPFVYEILKVEWPDGTIYYGVLATDEVASVSPGFEVEARMIPDGSPDWFLPIPTDASIGDEDITVEMWDGDEVFSTLLNDHGEGVKCTALYWFPQETLLLPVWEGHLRYEDEATVEKVTVKIVQGFRSSDATVPDRPHYRTCAAVFGGLLDSQDEIDEHNGCPYNFHLGGGIGNNDPSTGLPWTYCDRRSTASCIARDVPPAYHLSHATATNVVLNRQTSGNSLFSVSQGNETNLKEPVTVIMGTRRKYGMKVMAYRRDLNNNNPEHGWFFAQYEACEGPVAAIYQARFVVGGKEQNVVAMHYNYRLGHAGQSAYPAGNYQLTSHTYSGTAHILYNFGWIDPSTIGPSDAEASAMIQGLNNIRVYTDADTYTETYTDNRVWQIMHVLCNKRWGFGLDYDKFNIDSWIAAAEWAGKYVRFTDTFGNTWDHIRAKSDVELIGKKVQEQIEDLCTAGRLSLPFLFNGEIYIEPLRKLTAAELEDAPVFTDTGETRNIVWEDGRTTLTASRKSDLDLVNRIECTFDDIDQDFLETPLSPVEDVDAQLRAGRVVGGRQRKTNPKKHNLLGITVESHALKVAWSLLDLGPRDEGGLANNLTIKFKTWFLDTLTIHQEKVIKVESDRLTKYGFEYFRIKEIKRQPDLTVEITAQAYNVEYMDAFETDFADLDDPELPGDYDPPTYFPPAWEPPLCPLNVTVNKYESNVLNLRIEPCGDGVPEIV